jgi:signal transduction histidine kinase
LLTLLKLELAALRGAIEPDSLQAACVHRLGASVDELVAMSRDLIARLRPPALDLGLVPALEWLAGQWTRQTGLACEFSCALDDLALPDEQATTLFRVVQESLTNAARHARATWVHIRLGVRQGELDLRVADNGCGFDPGADHAGHYGLLGMRERALRVGARLELNSRPGAGTEVRVAMPLPTVPA